MSGIHPQGLKSSVVEVWHRYLLLQDQLYYDLLGTLDMTIRRLATLRWVGWLLGRVNTHCAFQSIEYT